MGRREELDERRARLSATRRALLDRHLAALYEEPTMRDLSALVRPADSAPSPTPRLERAPSLEGVRSRAVAIIGLAGRFPGAPDVDQFWKNLREGVESIAFFPPDDPRISAEERALPNFVRAASVLPDIDLFDAGYFGFSPREAEVLDPQLRILLECAVEALENAGYQSERPALSVGLFAGASTSSYLLNIFTNPAALRDTPPLQIAIGNDRDALTTTISYKLNLSGPSVNVQTFCSTSLVAVHLARSSLIAGECDLALAGGISVKVAQRHGYLFQEEGIWSPDGRCRAFDARAQGTIFGDGAGLVVLKRLEDALRDGDSVRAVIIGSAINNDGSAKSSYAAPSAEGQARVILGALNDAGLSARDVSYVEAHGTGTALGDPIEVSALTRAFRVSTADRDFCGIGSVKSNVGHLDRAAGISSLIKTVLALEQEELPPSLHVESPNPEIDFPSTPFHVNTRLTPWPRGQVPRRAGVTALGIGGTNVHVVLEEAPASPAVEPPSGPQLLVLSAMTEAALDVSAARLAGHLEVHPELALADVAYTLQVGRRELRHRRALVVEDRAEALRELARSGRPPAPGPRRRSVVFVFPGQGAQHPGMGRELYLREARYREEVDRAASLVEQHAGISLLPLLHADAADEVAAAELRQTMVAQLALFVTEHALARLLMEAGLQPAALLGHSIGEYVAACLAGVFSLEDAIAVISQRGRLMQALPPGAMLSVAAPEAELADLIQGTVSLAAVNAPDLCVLSGPPAEMTALAAELERRGLAHNRLHTSHAFHSSMMDPILDAFRECVANVGRAGPSIPCLSNLTGGVLRAEDTGDPAYFARHLRDTVRFSACVETLLRGGPRLFIEVGPGSALTSVIRRQAAAEDHVAVRLMRARGDPRGERAQLLEGLGQAWVAGAELDFAALHRDQRRRRVPLPSYPFERRRYWIEAHQGRAIPSGKKKADLADWFSVPSFERAPPAQPRQEKERWLLLGEPGLTDDLAAALAARGHQVVRAGAGVTFARRDEGSYTLRPLELEDYTRLLESLRAEDRLPTRVVHAHFLSPALERQAFESGVLLLRALARELPEAPLELSLLTREAHDVIGTEEVRPLGAMALGISKCAPLEIPHLRCRAIDLDGQEDVAALVAELEGDSFPPLIARRGPHRWVEGYRAIHVPAAGRSSLQQGDVWVITGGLGGIGLELAAHLAGRPAARLVLLGRSGLAGDDPRIRRIRALEQAGAEVLVLAADVTVKSSLADALARARARFGRIRGVIHAAGVAGGGVIQAKTLESLRRVTQAKVEGTIHLAELTAEDDAHLVLCSSIAAVTGNFGQVDYTAANAFMDAYAARRTERRVLSLNWSAWSEVGMAVNTQIPESLRAARALALASAISPAEGAAGFERALSLGVRRVVIASLELESYFEAARASVLAEVEPATRPRRTLTRESLVQPYAAPTSETEKVLVEIWGGLFAVEPIGIDDDFFDLGGNSLLALQVVPELRKRFPTRVSSADLFERTTIRELGLLIDDRDDRAQLGDERQRRGEQMRLRRMGRTPGNRAP